MSKHQLIRIGIFTLASALFVWSLFEPVWACGKGGRPLDGMSVLISGFMALLYFDPRWFCNIVVILAIRVVPFRHPVKKRGLSMCIAAAGTTAIFGPYFCAPGGGALGPGTAFAIGGYLWVCSLWLFALAVDTPWVRENIETNSIPTTNS